MPGELLLGAAGKALMETIIEEAVKRGAPPLIAELRRIIHDWRKAPHPSLKDLRTICDWLEPFRIWAEHGTLGKGHDLPKVNSPHFRQKDMTPSDIAKLWFGTDTRRWTPDMVAIVDRWQQTSSGTVHYYRGTEVEFDYGDGLVPKAARHPFFKSVHPFIMLSRVPRTSLGDNPVAEAMDYFLEGWEAFVADNYTTFRLGIAVKLDTQAYVEGYFDITSKGQCRIGNKVVGTNVTLWRCMIVTATAHSVEIFNAGIPASADQGEQYLGYLYAWMDEFRKEALKSRS